MVNEPSKTIQSIEEATAWKERHEPFAPRAGELAPDFSLFDIPGEQSIQLSDLRNEKPVALIFGSFT